MMTSFDFTFVVYLLIVFVSLWGFTLFIWWWNKIGDATDVYIFVALLFLTNAFSDIIAGYSRYLAHINPKCLAAFHNSFIWEFRRIPELIILSLFVIRMHKRVFGVLRREKAGEITIGPGKAQLGADAGEKREDEENKKTVQTTKEAL